MAQFFEIHPENPQLRLIHQAVDIIRNGGFIAYPTDSSYAIARYLGDKQAMDKIRRLRQLGDSHDFTRRKLHSRPKNQCHHPHYRASDWERHFISEWGGPTRSDGRGHGFSQQRTCKNWQSSPCH